MDPPEHRDYRDVTAKQFTPRMTQHWEPKVQRITREILDEAGEKGACDFVQDVAAPITIAVIAEMLGVPGDGLAAALPLDQRDDRARGPRVPARPHHRGDADRTRARSCSSTSTSCRRSAARTRRTTSSRWSCTARSNGKPIEPFELLSYYLLLVVAGNETTRNAMTGGMLAFNDNPDQWRRAGREREAARPRGRGDRALDRRP